MPWGERGHSTWGAGRKSHLNGLHFVDESFFGSLFSKKELLF
jgi:hypothetical protein